jgi:hypothetical protein
MRGCPFYYLVAGIFMRGRMAGITYLQEAAMDAHLQKLVELQIEQNQLLKRYLWRFRFSLLTLLLLTTATCCGLGFLVYREQAASQAARQLLRSQAASAYYTFRQANAYTPSPKQPTQVLPAPATRSNTTAPPVIK